MDVCSGDGGRGLDDEQTNKVDKVGKVGERGGDFSVSELNSTKHAFGSDGVIGVTANEGTRFGCATQLLAGSSLSPEECSLGDQG